MPVFTIINESYAEFGVTGWNRKWTSGFDYSTANHDRKDRSAFFVLKKTSPKCTVKDLKFTQNYFIVYSGLLCYSPTFVFIFMWKFVLLMNQIFVLLFCQISPSIWVLLFEFYCLSKTVLSSIQSLFYYFAKAVLSLNRIILSFFNNAVTLLTNSCPVIYVNIFFYKLIISLFCLFLFHKKQASVLVLKIP